MQLLTPLGPVEWVPRDFVAMPRNKPPTVRTKAAQLRGVTIHYSGGNIGAVYGYYPIVEADEILVAQAIRNHNARPGFSDVGYQLLIGRSGVVWEGRGVDWCNAANGALRPEIVNQYPPGTTTSNAYWQSIFFCCGVDGEYRDATPAQWEAARRMVAYNNDRFNIANPVVNGHRDVRQTLCPGDTLLARPLSELLEGPNDMLKQIKVPEDSATFVVDGVFVSHIIDGNVQNAMIGSGLLSPVVDPVERIALKALHPLFDDVVYGPGDPTPLNKRTYMSDFAPRLQ